jgi:hypothetical protein
MRISVHNVGDSAVLNGTFTMLPKFGNEGRGEAPALTAYEQNGNLGPCARVRMDQAAARTYLSRSIPARRRRGYA